MVFAPCLLDIFAPFLHILLEAMFTFVFWTIRIKTKFGLGMHGMCQWTIEDLEYEGLCSHTLLKETIVGDLELSAEEWEEMARDRKRAQAERSTNSLKKINLQSPERKREDLRKNTEKFREATKASCQKNSEKNRKLKRFYDPICDRAFANRHQLEAHLPTSVHLKKAAELQLSSSGSSS
jgi:hypothetical protein